MVLLSKGNGRDVGKGGGERGLDFSSSMEGSKGKALALGLSLG